MSQHFRRLLLAIVISAAGGVSSVYAQAISSVALTTNLNPPQLAGTSISVTAVPSGGAAPFTYKWWQFNGATWSLLQDWSTSSTLMWTPTQAHANTRIGVWVRNAGNTADGVCDAFHYCASIEFSIVSTCSYSLGPSSVNIGSEGGSGTISVSTMAACTWAPNSNATWLTSGMTSQQQGPGVVSWTATSNVGMGGSREGGILIGNLYFNAFQCEQVVSPQSITVSAGSGTATVNVISSGSCPWTASAPSGSFASVTGGATGTGQGPITISYAANPTIQQRSAVITVAGQPVTLTQAAAPCTYALSPGSVNVGAEGGAGSFAVSAPAGCTWTPNSNATWLTPGDASQQQGAGTVTWTATPNINTGGSREGGILIGNQYFNAFQCEQVVSPQSITVPGGSGTATVNVISSGSCPWTASAPSGSFASVTGGATGTGQGIVTVAYQATGSSHSRATTIIVAGQLVTLTQAGAACTFQFTPSTVVADSAGDTGTFAVTPTPADCTWAADSNAVWLNPGDTFAHQGDGIVRWTASANASGGDRQGLLHIGSGAFQVDQCFYTISQSFISVGANGGVGSISLRASSPGCRWSVGTQSAWTTLSGPTSGTGNAVLSYTVSPNPDESSRGTVLHIAGRSVGLSQLGTQLVCEYSISPDSITIPAEGSSLTALVTAPSGCEWTATTESSFVAVTGGASGSGSGGFNFTISNNYSGSGDTNPARERYADIRVGPRALAITQLSYTPPPGPSCATIDVMPQQAVVDAGNTDGILRVSGPAECSWTALSESNFIAISSTSGGLGSGTVTYSVENNTSAEPRTGSLLVAGRVVRVVQAGVGSEPQETDCIYAVSPREMAFGPEGVTGAELSVITQPGCAWSAQTGSAFIHLNATGTGAATFTFTLDANGSQGVRTGTITVADATAAISQGGTTSSAPCEVEVDIQGEDDSLTGQMIVTAPPGCQWTATAEMPWIALSRVSGTGSDTITYSLRPMGMTEFSTGQILVGNRTVTVAGPSVPIPVPGMFCREYRLPCGPGNIEIGWDLCTWVWCLPTNPLPAPQPPPERDPTLIMRPANPVRGQIVFFTILDAMNAEVRDWKYEPAESAVGSVTRSKDRSNRTWPGAMVASGKVTVTVRRGGRTFPLERTFTVAPRGGWMFPPQPRRQLAQGETAIDKNGTPTPIGGLFANDPALGQEGAGKFSSWIHWDAIQTRDVQVIDDDGPNHGLRWVLNITDATLNTWVVHPDLENPLSEFYRRQCGNWTPAPGNTCTSPIGTGFISGANYEAGVKRHEAGERNSHYAQYVDAQGHPSRNIKAGAEEFVRKMSSFADFRDALEITLTGRKNAIDSFVNNNIPPPSGVWACPAQCSDDCLVFNGGVNTNTPTQPYAQCPP